jgi:hypothetical protein
MTTMEEGMGKINPNGSVSQSTHGIHKGIHPLSRTLAQIADIAEKPANNLMLLI